MTAKKYGTVLPVRQAVYEGSSDIFIRCFSCKPVTWFGKIGNIKGHIKEEYVLRFQNIQTQDTGNYTCHGTLEDNSTFTAHSELLVGGIFYY